MYSVFDPQRTPDEDGLYTVMIYKVDEKDSENYIALAKTDNAKFMHGTPQLLKEVSHPKHDDNYLHGVFSEHLSKREPILVVYAPAKWSPLVKNEPYSLEDGQKMFLRLPPSPGEHGMTLLVG